MNALDEIKRKAVEDWLRQKALAVNDPMPAGPVEDLGGPYDPMTGQIDAAKKIVAGPVAGQPTGETGPGPNMMLMGGSPVDAVPPPSSYVAPIAPVVQPSPDPGGVPTGVAGLAKMAAEKASAPQPSAETVGYAPNLAALKAKYGGGGGGGGGAPKNPLDLLTANEKMRFQLASQNAANQGEHDLRIAEEQAKLGKYNASKIASMQGVEEDYAAKVAEIERKRASFVDDEMAKQTALAESIANTQIDPNHFWAEAGTGARILAGIGVFLSGLGGNGNQALDSLNAAIDRDIQAQKANLNNKYAALAEKKGVYAQRLATFGDEKLAVLSAKASSLQVVGYQMESKAAQTSNAIAKENAMRGAQLIGEHLQQIDLDMRDYAQKKANDLAKAQMAAASASASKLEKRNEKVFEIRAKGVDALQAEYAKKGIQTLVDVDSTGMPYLKDMQGKPIVDPSSLGLDGVGAESGASATIFGPADGNGKAPVLGNAPAKSKEDARKLDELGQNYADAMALLTDFEKHIDDEGTTYNPWGANADKSDALQSKLFGKIKGMAQAKGGSPGSSENDAKLLMKQIPSPGAFWSGDAKARVEKLKADLTNEYENGKKAFLAPGAQPVNETVAPPAK